MDIAQTPGGTTLNVSKDHPFPFITPEDLESTPLFTAAQRLGHHTSGSPSLFPALNGVILLHQARALRTISRKHHLRRARGFPKELYLLSETGGTIGVATNFGVGAPATAVIIEELAVLGTRKLIAIGIAGGLQEVMHTGDMTICERAIREEGTSHHYLLPSKYAFPSPNLTRALAGALEKMGRAWISGISWTIDAPYRETLRKVEKYRQEGSITVEMEAAAVFAVCAYLGIESGAAFIVADTLPGLVWQPGYDQKKMATGLAILFDAAVRALETP
jgi:uridine phosphorylase